MNTNLNYHLKIFNDISQMEFRTNSYEPRTRLVRAGLNLGL